MHLGNMTWRNKYLYRLVHKQEWYCFENRRLHQCADYHNQNGGDMSGNRLGHNISGDCSRYSGSETVLKTLLRLHLIHSSVVVWLLLCLVVQTSVALPQT